MENKASYAENFRIRIGQIQQEVAPIARSNGAMAFTRKRAKLMDAMGTFRGLLKYSGEREFPWFVRFPDRSEFTLGCNDTFEELKILRSLESRPASRSRPGPNYVRRAHA
jgi:hypothetical protein